MSGEVLVLHCNPEGSVLELKRQVERAHRTPLAAQVLLAGTRVLPDGERLAASQGPEDTVLALTLLLTAEVLAQDLSDARGPQAQLRVLDTLRCWSEADTSGGALHVLSLCLGDAPSAKIWKMWTVRDCKGHIYQCILDDDVFVRCSALRMLPEVLERGDERIIELLCLCLQDGAVLVRETGRVLLHTAVGNRHEGAITSVLGLLEHAQAEVRLTALMVFSEPGWARRGEKRVVDALIRRLQGDQSRDVRRAAVGALFCVASAEDNLAVFVLSEALKDPDARVRDAAVVALYSCARKGDRFAIYSAASLLEHESAAVRRSALQVLQEVAEQGDDFAIFTVKDKISSQDVGVVRSAADALFALSTAFDDGYAKILRRQLSSNDQNIRQSALRRLNMGLK